MNTVKENSVTISAEMQINSSAEAIWPLLCPVREYDWIERWDCELVHTQSGINELGCVFHTGSKENGDFDTWVTSRFNPMERLEFIRMNGQRVIRYEILLIPDGSGTRMSWIQHITPLNEEGREAVKDWKATFKQHMVAAEKMLNHYLETGHMLRV